MGTSIRLGKIFGIPVGINYSWILVFLLFTYLLSLQFGEEGYPDWSAPQRWLMAAATSVLFFLSVLAHELSHSVVAVSKGIPVRGITLFIFGGVSQLAHEARRPFTEFLVAVVGPSLSIALGLVLLGLWYLMNGVNAALGAILFALTWINLSLGVFNMLPGFPLDGGRVLRAAVWGISRSYWRGTQVATRSGQVIGVTMIIGGVAMAILFSGRSFQGIWMALIGGFLWSAASASYRQEQSRESLRPYRVADIMTTDWGVLPGQTPLESPLVVQGLSGRHDFLAVSMEGEVGGILTRRKLAQVRRGSGPEMPISAVMLPLSALTRASPEEEAVSVLERMEIESLDRLAVFRGPVLLGFVSRESAVRFMQARR